MNKICTSIEQSKKLLELGIDVNTADMDYIQFANELASIYNIENYFNEINKETKLLVKNSLLPNKFHIRDFIKILKNSKYEKMFFIIEKK